MTDIPDLPQIELELVEDASPEQASGFLRLVRRKLRARYPDGTTSEVFTYDEVDRAAIDAVVMAAHFVTGGQRHVYLRSALRPPLVFRDRSRSPIPTRDGRGLWELPAGLVESTEQSPAGLRRSAQRELLEELGFDVKPEALLELGPSTFPAPGVLAERHFYFEVSVDPDRMQAPALDGSPLEQFGRVVAIPLAAALAACADGRIEDAKTELCLRRLADRYP